MTETTLGIILAFSASMCWAVGAILIRLGIHRVSPSSATFISIAAGFVFVAIIAVIMDPSAFLELNLRLLGGFALVALLSFMGGRFFYYTAVSKIGVGRATAMGGAMPIFASILAVMFLDERVTIQLAIGILAVVIGVGLIVTGPTQES